MSAAKSTSSAKSDYRIPASSSWSGLWRIFAVIGVIGLGGALAGMTSDPHRFAFSYLFGFMVFLTVALGAMFFVLVQHLVSASWSVGVRRTAEFFMAGFPMLAVLFIPILLVMPHLFPWLGGGHGAHDGAQHGAATHAAASAHAGGGENGHGEHGAGEQAAGEHGHAEHGSSEHGGTAHDNGEHGSAEHGGSAHSHAGGHHAHVPGTLMTPDQIEHEHHQHLLHNKAPYLNKTFFLIRVVLYFLIWIFAAMRLFGWSTQQDQSKDPQLTVRQAKFAPPMTFLFGITLTFAVFDWLMSLMPTWFSTIFGVQIFAGSAMTIMAVLILVTMGLRNTGAIKNEINTEHYHDLGKLLIGFTAFWAYITFSQFFLIWYAAIPEETQYYHIRWGEGPWRYVSLGIVVFHFIVPFWFLMSRNIKRRPGVLALGAALLVCMHVVEMYWHVLPNYRPGLAADHPGIVQLHWMDFASLVGVGGLYLALVFYRMARHPVIPVGDPRLSRSLGFQNA